MITRVLNHNDTVVSVLLAEPFADWRQWRTMEDIRLTLAIDPRKISKSLEEVRQQFDDSTIAHMTRVGTNLLHDMVEGEISATGGYQLCLTRWDELPYFTRKPRETDEGELTDVFFRYPWFFYLLFTDPVL